MRRWNLAVAALLGAALISCAADEKGKPKEESGGKSRADRLREIQDAYRENEQKLVKELQAATTPEGQREIFFQF
ncbi:MAG TPA: hypothetical protein VIL46_05995, partial [Gemmataceae bacterium]